MNEGSGTIWVSMQPICEYFVAQRVGVELRSASLNGWPECRTRPSLELPAVGSFWFPSKRMLRTLYWTPSEMTNVSRRSPGSAPERTTGVTLASKKPRPW